MIYTLGCSFTKWHWPTWADWLGNYQSQSICNLAHPGYTNSLIYYQLLRRIDKISKHDQVYIMWTGSNRTCEWYDRDHIYQQDFLGFFPETDGQLWFTHQTPYLGLYKSPLDRQPSLSHMQIEMFNTILQTQLLLNQCQCEYRMMFWQNPWCDTREIFKPQYDTTWQDKSSLTTGEIEQAQRILDLPVVQSLITQINWEKFVAMHDNFKDPISYNGLWEYTISSKELVSFAHQTDAHPNTLAHHDWTVKFLCGGITPHLRSSAKNMAQTLTDVVIPAHDRRNEIWNLVDH